MKLTTTLLPFFIALMPTGCIHMQRQQIPHLRTPQIEKYFTSTEIQGLEKIILFVDSLILVNNKFKADEIDKAYHYYRDSIFNHGFMSDNPDITAFDQKIRHEFIFSLDTVLFNKIWIKPTIVRISTKDTVLYRPENFISIILNPFGEFAGLLKDWGDSAEYYRSTIEVIQMAGDISPTVIADFFKCREDFDFNNARERLWAAIFLLTLGENPDKAIKRYLNHSQ